ncbi:MAG: flippase-like domain-containing protein, partial [Chloroflexi bacterium]|nr:flippase-like domain-containing protein [Chloroflexota bacterium]MCI0889270.1 flippase-like domain-containing protein [Chloroflexota bacterium]
GAVLFVAVSRHRPTAMRIIHLGDRIPVVKRFVPQIEEFYESTYALMSPRAVILMGALSTFSWFFEVLGFYFTFIGLGLDGGSDLLLKSAFILPIATLASALLLTPGGLGVAEGALVTLSVALLDISRSAAAVATFIIRFGTLWFGVIIGLIAFAVLSRRISLDEDPETAEPATAESPP